MRHTNASLRHDLDQIPGTELETQVPPHAEDNDFAIEVSPFKQIHSGRPSEHSRIMAGATTFSRLCTRANVYTQTSLERRIEAVETLEATLVN